MIPFQNLLVAHIWWAPLVVNYYALAVHDAVGRHGWLVGGALEG